MNLRVPACATSLARELWLLPGPWPLERKGRRCIAFLPPLLSPPLLSIEIGPSFFLLVDWRLVDTAEGGA
jgi:hypothetical protein